MQHSASSGTSTRGPRIFLVIGGVIMLAVGLYFGANPTALSNGMGIELPKPSARSDARAVYGGFQCAIGLFMLWSLRSDATLRSGLVLGAMISLGAVVGRLVGFAIDGPDIRNVVFGGVELVGGLAAIWFARRAPTPLVTKHSS